MTQKLYKLESVFCFKNHTFTPNEERERLIFQSQDEQFLMTYEKKESSFTNKVEETQKSRKPHLGHEVAGNNAFDS